MISVQVLSWNRPFRLALTLASVFRILRASGLPFEVLLFDQGSSWLTRFIVGLFPIKKVIWKNKNVGIARAWNELFEIRNLSSKFIIPLENDWWCSSWSPRFLKLAVDVLDSFSDVPFVKLRANFDGQAGYGMLHKEPQTVFPLPIDCVTLSSICGHKVIFSEPRFACFTFNPVLMRCDFRMSLAEVYLDNPSSGVSLARSGEDFPTAYWESQNRYRSAILDCGPFRHTGFHSRRYVWTIAPLYGLIELVYWVLTILVSPSWIWRHFRSRQVR